MSDLSDLKARVGALESELADVLHPLATQHRYEMAGQLRAAEERLTRLEKAVEALGKMLSSQDQRDDGEDWKRGTP